MKTRTQKTYPLGYSVNCRGELLFSSDGSFEYNPNKDFFGSDVFTYYVSDGILNSDTATVSITINLVMIILTEYMMSTLLMREALSV